MGDLKDFIHIYENALETDVCDFLIKLFDKVPQKHEHHNNDGKPNFTQFNLTENCELAPEVNRVHNYIIEKIFEYRDKYYEFANTCIFPKEHSLEQFRIKRYNPGGEDRFDTHVDVTNHDSSRRFLSFMWYLNTVENGGNTVFSNMSICPQKGTLLIFPPLWMYPHCGEAPMSGPKYIMSTYLHYK